MPKPVRVLLGTVCMVAVVAVGLGLLVSRAGEWGVPYFSFPTDNGTRCTNTWAGYECHDLTIADYDRWSDFPVPAGSTLVASSYSRTSNDFTVTAQLRTDSSHSEAVGKDLTTKYGACLPVGVRPVELVGYDKICLINSDLMRGTQQVPLSRRWSIATGVAKDGSRLTVVNFSSR